MFHFSIFGLGQGAADGASSGDFLRCVDVCEREDFRVYFIVVEECSQRPCFRLAGEVVQ